MTLPTKTQLRAIFDYASPISHDLLKLPKTALPAGLCVADLLDLPRDIFIAQDGDDLIFRRVGMFSQLGLGKGQYDR